MVNRRDLDRIEQEPGPQVVGADQPDESSTSTTEVETGANPWLVGGLGAFVVAVLALYLMASSGADEETVAPDEPTTSTAPVTSTTPSTTSGPDPEDGAAVGELGFQGDWPVTGQETGYQLLYSEGTNNILLDLDTGERTVLPTHGQIMGANEKWVIYYGTPTRSETNLNGLGISSATDPGAQPKPITEIELRPDAYVEPTADPDVFMFFDHGSFRAVTPSGYLFNVETGAIEVTTHSGFTSNGLIQSRDGRIFDYRDGRSRLLLVGYELIAAGVEHFLVRRCPDSPTDGCAVEWRSRENPDIVVARELPPVDNLDTRFMPPLTGVGGSDRLFWVGYGYHQVPVTDLWDVETGSVFTRPGGEYSGHYLGVSPDDRFAVFVVEGSPEGVKTGLVELTVLDSGERFPIVEWGGGVQNFFLLPKPASN